jgi:hypothetical protein
MVVEIKSSNCKGRYHTSDGERECPQAGEKALTREIFTDCERAWDNDNFVLEINLNALDVARQRNPLHVA